MRRIASHTKDQGFLGLSFSQDDMATTAYGPLYSGVISETPPACRPSSPSRPRRARTRRTRRSRSRSPRTTSTIAQLKYFNGDGTNVKTETRSGYTCEGDVCTPGELKMVDNVKGNWTKLVAKSRKVNEEISDDVFSQRNLGE